MSANAPPLGVRLNNPGNIRLASPPKLVWKGQLALQPGDQFCRFVDPEHGIRAMAVILTTYQQEHGLRTLRSMISRWAPPGDHNDTASYIRHVAEWSGIEDSWPVDMTNVGQALAVVAGMVRQEQGYPPYTDATIKAGLKLAGIG